jgi:hypothetical protein
VGESRRVDGRVASFVDASGRDVKVGDVRWETDAVNKANIQPCCEDGKVRELV